MVVSTPTSLRHQLLAQVKALPNEALPEVAQFIEYWQFKATRKPVKRRNKRWSQAAFGMWADRTDIKDGASFSLELRRRMERRANGNPAA